MRNAGAAFFFARPLAISNGAGSAPLGAAALKIDVRFFLEGGSLVAGQPSVLGLKATDEHGRGVVVQGTVLDAQQQPVASFTSRHAGMGSFEFTPAPGQAYQALVTLPGGRQATYPLPASQPVGYTLRVTETPTDFVVAMRPPATGAAAGPALLLAQVRGKVAFAAQATLGAAAPVVARLPKARFAPGLAQLTLFDAQGVAQCERLVFVPNPPGARLTLSADKPAYGPREAVRLRLAATDAAGQPVAGQFSVAVAAATPLGADGPTILSHLLLSSDLGGVLEDPSYYFREPQTPDIKLALNDLLLTQGWRRFVWKELLAGQLPGREFALEQGLGVSSQVLTAAGQPAAGQSVAYLQTNPPREGQQLADAAGHFRFRGLDGLDTTAVLLRAAPAKGAAPLALRLLAPPPATPLPDGQPAATTPGALADYARRSQQRTLAQRYHLGTGTAVVLGTVRVRGQRPTADTHTRTYSAANAVVLQVPDAARTGDSRSVLQYLQGRVAGVAVSGNSITIRQAASLQNQGTGSFGLVEPLYLIDGAIVPAETFSSYPVREIETIDVLNQSAAGLFGIQGYGGVIALHSRQSSAPSPLDAQAGFGAARPGVLSVRVPGYYRAREFYAPRYDAPSPPPDPRYTTLYWVPEVRTDASGQAQLSFYTSEATGEFQAVAEGLSAAGVPLRGTATLSVRAGQGK
ncbi:MAG: TonB-dependent receptor plug domain-containing protein [Janthinobacterium lividum]